MDRYNESLAETHTDPENQPHVIDYAKLVEAVQLSVARLLDVSGADEANSFSEISNELDDSRREKLIREVGARFDQQLIKFVTSSLILSRNQKITIRAEASEGVNGSLPWQEKLENYLENCKQKGFFVKASIEVERYSAEPLVQNEGSEEPAEQVEQIAA